MSNLEPTTSAPARDGQLEERINEYTQQWEGVKQKAVGYPRNWLVHQPVQEMMNRVANYGVHNVGDWEAGSRFAPNAFEIEAELISFFMKLFHCETESEDYWGYIDACGSSGNIWCTTIGKETLKRKTGKTPIMIFSKAAHYSFITAALQNSVQAVTLEENDDGALNIDALKDALHEHPDQPIWVGILCGGTVKEGRDNIRQILQTVKNTGRPRRDFYFHVDGAFSAVPLALMNDPADYDIIPNFALSVGSGFTIDSLNVSTHKFIGTLDTGGLILMHRRHSDAMSFDVEYIQSRNNTMVGSRNARAIIECWLLIKYLGTDTLANWAHACAERARRMKTQLQTLGVKNILLNHNALTLYFKEICPKLSQEYCLAPQQGYVHVIVTPHTLHHSLLGRDKNGKDFESCNSANKFVEAVWNASLETTKYREQDLQNNTSNVKSRTKLST